LLQIHLAAQYRKGVAEAGKAAALVMEEIDSQPAEDKSHWPTDEEAEW